MAIKQAVDEQAMSPMKRALLAMKTLQAKIDALEEARAEPLAIIGMGCRFPHEADTPEKFWELLRNGKTMLSEVPAARWDVDAYFHAEENLPLGKTYTRQAGFLSQVDEFDARFFGISGREARKMDPQQRILLEVGWEAFERAGLTNADLMGSNTGVFLGVSTQDYYHLSTHPIEQNDMYTMSGNNISVAAGRLAYVWGLTGPTFSVDTACSSSLVALHLACQSLRAGECDVALTGGIALMLTPHFTVQMAQSGALSPDGVCKTFSAQANGYGQGEGCGLVVLKRLSDALRDEDNIVAMIRGSAINHDGRSSGLTVPSAIAQQNVIKQAHSNSGIEADHVGYIEAHGTGTLLGDPIEAEALGAVFKGRSDPLMIGSVKTNLGHLDSAAGITGVIKTALALQHRQLPAHLHCAELNPRVDWENSLLEVVQSLQPFPERHGVCLAGVSAFGVSGTNAHVVLEAAPENTLNSPSQVDGAPHISPTESERPWHVLNLSAKSENALQALAKRYQDFLNQQPDTDIASIAYTANTSRSHFEYRLSLAVTSVEMAATKLAAYCRNEPGNGVIQGYVPESQGKQRIAFLFTGQGSEYRGMGQQLYKTQALFRVTLDRCAAILDLEQPLLSILFGEHPQDTATDYLSQTQYTQPALFALEYSLAKLWQSWGVEPDVVIGHNVGEYVAACIAGVFSLEDALKLIAARGSLMQGLPRSGAMLSTVAMKPMLDEFRQVANTITYHLPQCLLISNVTGQQADKALATPDYWVSHVGSMVRFSEGAKALFGQNIDFMLEIGPKPILLGLAKLQNTNPSSVVPGLRENANDSQQLSNSLGQLYVHGFDVNWRGFNMSYLHQKVALPTYPWQREQYWIEAVRPEPSNQPSPDGLCPLIDRVVRLPHHNEVIFEKVVQAATLAFSDDRHYVGAVAASGATQLAMILDAAKLYAKHHASYVLHNVSCPAPPVIPAGVACTLQLVYSQSGDQADFQLFSSTEDSQVVQAKGQLTDGGNKPSGSDNKLASIQARRRREIDGITAEEQLHWVDKVWAGDGEILASLKKPEHVGSLTDYIIHPDILYACIQLPRFIDESSDSGILALKALNQLCLYQSLRGDGWLYGIATNEKTWDITLFDSSGGIVAELVGMECAAAGLGTLQGKDFWQNELYTVDWRPQPLTAQKQLNSTETGAAIWLLFTRPEGIGAELALQLQNQGKSCVFILPGYEYKTEKRYLSPAASFDVVTLDLFSGDDYQRVLETFAGYNTAHRQVLYLWDRHDLANVSSQSGNTGMPETVLNLCDGLLQLTQALSRVRGSSKLWLVTENSQTTGDNPGDLQIEQAPLWALSRTIRAEHPEFDCHSLDFDILSNETAVSLLDELQAVETESQVAYRSGQRFVTRWASYQKKTPALPVTAIRSDGSYLITGGLGGLGLQVALALVDAGAKYLILNSRQRVIQRNVQATIDQLTQAGARVEVISADVSDPAKTAFLLAECQRHVPLRGIIHAAGILDDGILLQQNRERFSQVMAAKVAGAWNLHLGSRAMGLDFFVAFSSVAALIEEPGQGNYAAANAFLDALMRQRHATGSNSLCINWGSWAEVGMAAELSFQQAGVIPIPPLQGASILVELIQDLSKNTPAQITVQPTHWPEYLSAIGLNTPLYADFFHHVQHEGAASKHTVEKIGLRRQLGALTGAARDALLMSYLERTAATILDFTVEQKIDPRQGLMNMGLDSLMAIEFRAQLVRDLKLPLPATLLFNHPTLDLLHRHLIFQLFNAVEKIAKQQVAQLPSNPLETPETEAGGEESVDDIAQMLAQALRMPDQ